MVIQQASFSERTRNQPLLWLTLAFIGLFATLYMVMKNHSSGTSFFSQIETMEVSGFHNSGFSSAGSRGAPLGFHPVPVTPPKIAPPSVMAPPALGPALTNKDAQKLLEIQKGNKKKDAEKEKKKDLKKPKKGLQVNTNSLDQTTAAGQTGRGTGTDSASNAAAPPSTIAPITTPAPTNANNNNDNNSSADTKTTAEWTSLLTSAPTSANIQKFLSAYAAHQMPVDEFYAVDHALLHSSTANVQKAGEMILAAVPAAKSFIFAVTEQKAAVNTDVTAALQTIEAAYQKSPALQTLQSVLAYSTDATVLQAALTAISSAFQALNTTQSGSTGSGASLATFHAFLPQLQRITNSTLQSQVQNLIALIQSSSGGTSTSVASNT